MSDIDNYCNVCQYNSGSTPSNYDIIARVWQTSDSSDYLNITATDTKSFFEKIFEISNENKLLRATLKNLWNVSKYNHEYISFLLGQYTDKEFAILAQKFATKPDLDIDKNKLIENISIIFSIIDDESLTSHDLSTILNIDCSLIESTMSSLS